MSVLEKIRSKTGLLVGFVGVALLIFILESLLGSGSALFQSNDTMVGKINGDVVDIQSFSAKVNEQIAQIQKSNPNTTVDERMKEQIADAIWNQMINDKVLKVHYKDLGITVSDDELADLMLIHPHQYVIQQLTDQQTGKIYEGFARPDGSLDLVKLNQWVSQMNAEQEQFWKQLEKSITEVRLAEKYTALVKKAMYATTAEAKDQFIAQNKQVTASFVIKRYSDVPDSTVKVTDEEINKYYNNHQNSYRVKETTRKIEYISYDVLPSKADYENLVKEAQTVAEEFKNKTTLAEDSAYIAQESEGGMISIANYGKKNMVVNDSAIYTASKGTVFGPYTEGTYLKIYKLEDVNSVADSAKVRHILIGLQNPKTQQQRTTEQAKRIADSLLVLLKAKQVNFDTLVKTMSDDMGSIDKGGDYGWFDETKSFVEPFKNAGLLGTLGDISVVPTQFGFHIIEVVGVSKTRHNSYKIAQITKLITPSEETAQQYYKSASDFAGKNQSTDAFNKAVDTEKLNKRIADNIKEGDKALPGLEDAKELIRWAYKANKGDVSPVYEFKDRFIVATLTGIKEKGIAPLEEVIEDVTIKAIRDKKAETFINEFKTKAGASTSINDIASKMGLTVEQADKLNFASFNLPAVGREDALIGTASSMKANTTSKPTKGENGVFVVSVSAVTEAVLPKEFKGKQQEIERMVGGRVDYEMFDALKAKANIEDHRGRFDF